MSGPYPSTEHNGVPNVDDTDLGGILADTAHVHPGIDLIRDGIRLLAHDRLDVNTTQVLLATLAGSPDATDILGAIGHLAARLASADTNPALRRLPLDQQKEAQRHGELAAFKLTDPDLRHPASDTCAALDT